VKDPETEEYMKSVIVTFTDHARFKRTIHVQADTDLDNLDLILIRMGCVLNEVTDDEYRPIYRAV